MDEILYLEPDEEITSVIDKLKKSESASVGLVIPRNATIIHSIVNLKLLKKKADELEKEIALVTADKIGKNIAAQVGLQVYEDVHAKRPANPIGMPELPKGDEVIEVDMSDDDTDATPGRAAKATTASGGLKIKHYDADAPAKSSSKTDDDPIIGGEEDESPRANKEFTSRTVNRHIDDESAYQPVRSSRSARRVPKALVIVGVLAIVLFLATLLGLPQTAITLTVAAEPFEKSVGVTIDTEAKEVKTGETVVPGQMFEVTNDDARRVVATGKKDVGTKAKGTVTIANSYQTSPYRIPAGTTFTSSDGKEFSLVSEVTVPGPTLCQVSGQLAICPGAATATLQASEPGEAYNVKAGKFTIGGLTDAQREKITAEASKDFSGGLTKHVNVMTQSDIDNAKEALLADLNKEALETLKNDAKDKKLIEDAVAHEVVSVETNPAKADSETEYFDIKVKAKHKVIAFDEKQVQQVVDAGIRKEVPAEKELLLGEGDEFVVDVKGKDYASGKLELESKIKTKVGTRVDAEAAKKGLAGKSEAAARDQLAKVPNVKAVDVFVFPRWWWQDISFMGWNTRVKVVYE